MARALGASLVRSAPGLWAVVLLTLMGCASAAVPSAVPPSVPGSTTHAFPPTSAVPTVTPERSPTPVGTLLPAPRLAWTSLGATGLELMSVTTALEFAGAYIVVGYDDVGLFHVARSVDGKAWSMISIDQLVAPCAGWEPRPASNVYAAAADGRHAVLAGAGHAANGPCDAVQAVAWVTDDGVTWRRSEGFGARDNLGVATAVWPIEGGWEILVESGIDGQRSIWRSSDGMRWQQVEIVLAAGTPGVAVTIGAAPGGLRLMSQFNGQVGSVEVLAGLRAGESRLEESIDGAVWRNVGLTLPLNRGLEPGGIVPPLPDRAPNWLLMTVGWEAPPVTFVSPNLVDWEHATFPRDTIARVAITRYGYVAVGSTHCPPGSGSECQPAPAQYLSTDGLTWRPFETSVGDIFVVDGPAGVIGVSRSAGNVWVLPE